MKRSLQSRLKKNPFLYEKEDLKEFGRKLLDLIKSIKLGNDSAKESFSNYLLGYYRKKCRSMYRSLEEVDEASCIVIQRLLSKLDMFDLSKSPLPFIYRAMKNHSIDEFRKKVKRKSIEAAAAKGKSYVTYISDGSDTIVSLYRDDILEGLEKDIFISTYQTKLTEEEICKKYKLSKPKYRKLLANIVNKFKKEIYA